MNAIASCLTHRVPRILATALLVVILASGSALAGPCAKCLSGYADCDAACRLSGNGPSGTCAWPDSTDDEHCCACAPDRKSVV